MDSIAPLVSIGVPVYNGERHLAQALEALLQQTLTDFEIIISDNASTDGTEQICRQFAARDARIRYYRQCENLGLPRNWNFVAARACGTYFKWASANDYVDRRFLETCVDMLQAAPDAVLAFTRTFLVDEGLCRLYTGDFALPSSSPRDRLQTLWDGLALNNAIAGVIRRSALRRSDLIRPYQGSDIVLLAELALQGRFLLAPEAYFYRRVGPGAMSSHLSASEVMCLHDPAAVGMPLIVTRKYFDVIWATLRVRDLPRRERCRALSVLVRRALWARQTIWAELKSKLARFVGH